MNRLICRTSVVLATALLCAVSTAHAQEADPIQALYVTGGGYHDYEGQKRILTRGLAARANIEWTIDHEAGDANDHKLSLYNDPDWHEPFDVVVYNICFASVTDAEYVDRFTRAHRDSGTAAIVLHCAMHSYRDAETDAWNRLIGLRTYHHEQQQREFELEAVRPEHPIMAGFPTDGWRSPRDEIYIVEETFDELIPLAQAYGPETEEDHVVIWANRYGNARVFGTTAGHNNAVMADPVYLGVVARGLLWVVDKLADNGDPKPGYEGSGEGLNGAEPFDYENATRLTGRSIGTDGAWNDSDNTRDKALDGNTATFFDAPEGDGAWVGLDLGEKKVITGVRFAPREGYEDRLSGGRFQGANKPNFSDAVDLHTILWYGGEGIVSRRVEEDRAFRYVRYLSPDGGYCNISIVEFYGK